MAGGTAAAKAVIFDMDGVLADTAGPHYRAWKAVCAERGRELSEAEFHETLGTSTALTIRLLFGDALSDAEAAAMGRAKEEAFRREADRSLVPMDGAPELIRALAADGWRVGLGSSAPAKNVECVMSRFPAADLLTVRVNEDMVAAAKPAPDIFLKAAELLGARPERSVVIEDSLAGLEAARRGGMPAVGLTTSIARTRLLPVSRLVVDSHRELDPERLERLIDGWSEAIARRHAD